MQTVPELAVDYAKLESYFVELLNKLERIATVMERFDNVMNPTLGMAETALEAERRQQPSDPGLVPVTLRSVRPEE